MSNRGSGLLLHITSLPSKFGIGDLGPQAYRFVDLLKTAKQKYWQILPLNPTSLQYDNSPYHSVSAFAYNPLLISPERMVRDGFISSSDLEPVPQFPEGRIDYRKVTIYKEVLFKRAYEKFKNRKSKDVYESFCRENAYWLDDFALFMSLKKQYGKRTWDEWPTDLRDRKPEAIKKHEKLFKENIEMIKFLQYLFIVQWEALKKTCHSHDIRILGDIPIYVTYDSVDVWTHADIFKLDKQKQPRAVSGVPPDYFSNTGQLWGNPVYNWKTLKANGYEWWLHRIKHNIQLFDMVRIDHFRGLVAYWEVKADEKNAVNGKWVRVPAMDFFKKLKACISTFPIIAEDLGIITQDVRDVMEHFDMPGMKVLQFAFGDDFPNSGYLPHNLNRKCVLYTGTHDNNTVRGWYMNETFPRDKERVKSYFGKELSMKEISRDFIRIAMMSVADMVIFPIQDVLGLGANSRMNKPATDKGNWRWQLQFGQLQESDAQRLRELTECYGRT